jgi:sugar/nucleoside kinase (ribokinase family)
MKIVFVGHVCVDRNVVRGETEILYGGGVVHGAITARRLGAAAAVVTRCAEADRAGFAHLAEAGVEVVFLPSAASTSIENVYPTDNPDDRQSRLIARAGPFTEADMSGIAAMGADVVHVNPLWFGEFPPALLAVLRRRVKQLAADAQGFVRVPEPDGLLVHRPFADPGQVLSSVDVFKVDAHEAQVLSGEKEPQRAAQAVRALGPKLVLLTHREGVVAHDGRQCRASAFGAYAIEGRTGRGDTCTAAFLVGRGWGMDLEAAVEYAAGITTRKMQYRGPFRG